MEVTVARLEETVALFDQSIARLEARDPNDPLIEEIRLLRTRTLDAIEQLRHKQHAEVTH
jgi:hypothetical protein